jgi:hypothetical protein
VERARLAHPGRADGRHQLTVPRAGLLEGLPELLDVGVWPTKQVSLRAGGGLKARSRGARASDLVDFDRSAKPLTGTAPSALTSM